MTAIITGDIIDSRKQLDQQWLTVLKKLLAAKGDSPAQWEIYRGDQFQLEVDPENALATALEIKAALKKIRVDVRMSIGIGEKKVSNGKISERSGTAYIRSGETFETLKKLKTTLLVNTGNDDLNITINLMVRLALTVMDNWLAQSAEFFLTAIKNPSLSQEELGVTLGINQAAVSRRQKRAHFDLIMELDAYYRNKIKNIAP